MKTPISINSAPHPTDPKLHRITLKAAGVDLVADFDETWCPRNAAKLLEWLAYYVRDNGKEANTQAPVGQA